MREYIVIVVRYIYIVTSEGVYSREIYNMSNMYHIVIVIHSRERVNTMTDGVTTQCMYITYLLYMYVIYIYILCTYDICICYIHALGCYLEHSSRILIF